MSSTANVGHEGGNNEDVEADVSTRNSEARLENGVEGEEDESERLRDGDDLDEPVPSIEHPHTAKSSLAQDGGLERRPQATHEAEDEDVLQLNGTAETRRLVHDEPESGRTTPTARLSPLASPADSGSIPDDTPSLRGSLADSPGRVVSPSPQRRTPSRTASGALQPFERRFETRLSASPAGSIRAESPHFLKPHSRQISLSSRISGISSQDGDPGTETPQAPWDVIRWTKLRKITSQAFSEAGKRNFGRPTCMAVSALIAVGTSKGLVLGFDYHQTLKIIIGQGTKATECGSVTSLAISADYSTIASGHANGCIFTWEINRPARPFLQVPPLDRSLLEQSGHPDGHLSGAAILHLGFLGTRHTALVSADAGGMAFSHLATRGLGPVTRTIKTTRLLGRYPPIDPELERSRKPSSILGFSPLPLGNVGQATDDMGLTALLTPYLLVIVSTTPIAQTQHKSPRPKEVSPHSTLSGCLAWFPAVKLKSSNASANKDTSDTKLVYCWSNVLTVLDVKVTAAEETSPSKPPSLEFNPRSRWRAEEAIVAVQWLGRSVLGVLTISQRLLIVEDGSLQVTDSIDLLPRHIYHQDLFSSQLHTVVEQLNSEDPSLHGVVADAFYMSYKVYKGRTFLLGFNDLTVGSLSNWADRLMALMEAGDYIAAIKLATQYYAGSANNVTIGLPENDVARHEVVRERILAMMTASLSYTVSQHDDDRATRLQELAEVCFEACIGMKETEYLFADVFDTFEDAEEESIFVSTLEPYVLDGEVKSLPPEVVKVVISHFIGENQASRLEELLCRLEPLAFDLDQVTMLCRQHGLYEALIHIWTQAIGDYITPLVDLLSLISMLQAGDEDEDLFDNPFYESAMKVFPFLAYSLTGRRYPSGSIMDDDEASLAKIDLYNYLFAGTPLAWPKGSKNVFRTTDEAEDEPAFPYLDLLLHFDAASFLSMMNEAFEDPFLNELDDDATVHDSTIANGTSRRYKSRQQIIEILLDVMRHGDYEPEQIIYLDMFVARSLPKYPGQLVLSGSLLSNTIKRLCDPPSETLRDECQLSVEYLLSAFHPSNVSELIGALRRASFFRVLKSVYRAERMFTELLEAYFEDPEDRDGVFDCISSIMQPDTGLTPKQGQSVRTVIRAHVQELADIDTVLTAQTLVTTASDMLQTSLDALSDSRQQFVFLRALLEPALLQDRSSSSALLNRDQQSAFAEQYVQLMCLHDPPHVADYVKTLPSSDLRLEKVLPAMESSGVVDAAVALLARDGLARDAMERLVSHMQSLENALTSLLGAAASSPDLLVSQETCDDLVAETEKYAKVGIWLCQGQTATIQRRPRARTSVINSVEEDDLDLDEYLWLNLVDAIVKASQHVKSALEHLGHFPSEQNEDSFNSNKITSALRSNVQQTFTALMAATATPSRDDRQAAKPARPETVDNLSFLRVLRAFLNRAARSAPSLADLRAVLADIFSAYTFEQSVLSLANELLGSDTFTEIEQVHELRRRGWRPRTQVCEQCKRRAWGTGIGEIVWDEWVTREQEREAEKARKLLERTGGDEARRMSRGKARASVSGVEERDASDGEEAKRLALVVFACRHVFHRVCLDASGARGPGKYACPLCTAAPAG